jgi:hypothetical protein
MLVSRQSRNQKKSINKIVLPGVDLNSRTPKTWSRPSASVSSIIGAMPEEIQVDFALANHSTVSRWLIFLRNGREIAKTRIRAAGLQPLPLSSSERFENRSSERKNE